MGKVWMQEHLLGCSGLGRDKSGSAWGIHIAIEYNGAFQGYLGDTSHKTLMLIRCSR